MKLGLVNTFFFGGRGEAEEFGAEAVVVSPELLAEVAISCFPTTGAGVGFAAEG